MTGGSILDGGGGRLEQDVTRITVPNTLTLSIADRLAMGTECCQNDLSQLD